MGGETNTKAQLSTEPWQTTLESSSAFPALFGKGDWIPSVVVPQKALFK